MKLKELLNYFSPYEKIQLISETGEITYLLAFEIYSYPQLTEKPVLNISSNDDSDIIIKIKF